MISVARSSMSQVNEAELTRIPHRRRMRFRNVSRVAPWPEVAGPYHDEILIAGDESLSNHGLDHGRIVPVRLEPRIGARLRSQAALEHFARDDGSDRLAIDFDKHVNGLHGRVDLGAGGAHRVSMRPSDAAFNAALQDVAAVWASAKAASSGLSSTLCLGATGLRGTTTFGAALYSHGRTPIP